MQEDGEINYKRKVERSIREGAMVSNQKLKWKSDFDKGVLIQNFEKRGWQKATGEGKLRTLFCEFRY